MLTKTAIIKEIEENKKRIRDFGVKKLVLIGSYVDGTAKENSDIDLLVEFENGRGLFDDYVGLLHLLQDLFKRDVDIGEPDLIREELKRSILGGKKIEAKI